MSLKIKLYTFSQDLRYILRLVCALLFTPLLERAFAVSSFSTYEFHIHFTAVPFRSRFSAKIKSGFRICNSMQFGVFLVSLQKICASTPSTACTSSLILLAVFGFHRNLLRSCGFLFLPFLVESVAPLIAGLVDWSEAFVEAIF